MKTTTLIAIALSLLSATTTQAQDPFSGASYDVVIVRAGVPVELAACMTFHSGGRFSLDIEPLSMQWRPMTHYPTLFLAVTSPGHRTVVPYHMAAFGEILADRTLAGSGVYQDGSTFTFTGFPRGRCATEPQRQGEPAEASRSVSTVPAPDSDVVRLGDALRRAISRRFEPCWTPPGHYVPCDPPLDPLDANDSPIDRSPLAGSRFQLTVGSADGKVFEHCWTFGDDLGVGGAGLHKVTWRPEPGTRGGRQFIATGGTIEGHGLGYRGVLLGRNLLHVAGIDAFNGSAVVTEGYGQRVEHCEAR